MEPARPASDQELELAVGDVAQGGWCVAREPGGRVVLVRHTLPGERVLARLTESTAKLARAEAVEILEASPDRVEPPCPHAHPGGCGGCDWQHASLTAQRRFKAAVIAQQLRRIAGLDREVTVEPLPGDAGRPGLADPGPLRGARRRPGRPAPAPLPRDPRRRDLPDRAPPGQRVRDHPGPLAGSGIGGRGDLAEHWRARRRRHPGPPAAPRQPAGRAAGRPAAAWASGPRSVDRPGGRDPAGGDRAGRDRAGRDRAGRDGAAGRPVRTPGPPKWRIPSWWPRRARPDRAARRPVPAPDRRRTDLADQCGRVLASPPGRGGCAGGPGRRDPPPAARGRGAGPVLRGRALRGRPGQRGRPLRDGDRHRVRPGRRPRRPAQPQGQPWARIHKGDVAEVLGHAGWAEASLAVLDPPRAGVARPVLDQLLRPGTALRTVAYVSCDPATLARDIAVFAAAGWELGALRAFDAFPMTHHVECVATLTPARPAKPAAAPGGARPWPRSDDDPGPARRPGGSGSGPAGPGRPPV